MSAERSPASRMALHAISRYQERVAPRIAARCPHTPSCSEYSRMAYLEHGFWRGTRLTWRRLRRCRDTARRSVGG